MAMKEFTDYSLLAHNTFGIDVACKRFIECASVEEVQTLPARLTPADAPLLVIGEGSNLLFTRNYAGTVLHSAIKGIEAVEHPDSISLRCGSGELWDDVVAHAVSQGWSGVENLSLIPGTVGASAVQNIGAYGVEAKDVIETVEAVELQTGNLHHFANQECGYGYRNSRFKTDWKGRFFITHVTYRLSKTFLPNLHYGNIRTSLQQKGIANPSLQDVRDVIIEIRKAKLPDPAVEGNAGSFFMNPIVEGSFFETLQAQYPDIPHYLIDTEHVKIPAGWLIEQCGWKGKTLQRAGVHAAQALVLVNKGGATGNEVLALCNAICEDVHRRFGIVIRPEVNIL